MDFTFESTVCQSMCGASSTVTVEIGRIKVNWEHKIENCLYQPLRRSKLNAIKHITIFG